jgi:hypothetical protein
VLPNELVVALGGIFRRASPRMRHRLTDEFDAAGPWGMFCSSPPSLPPCSVLTVLAGGRVDRWMGSE